MSEQNKNTETNREETSEDNPMVDMFEVVDEVTAYGTTYKLPKPVLLHTVDSQDAGNAALCILLQLLGTVVEQTPTETE